MIVTAIVVSTLLAGTSASAAVPVSGDNKAVLSTVKVCVEAGPAQPFIVTQAESRAGQMFSDIGVKIEWRRGRRDCQARPEETIYIRLSVDSPATLAPGVLAYAMPYEGTHIEVFFDRILKMVEQRRLTALLAHVLAHEVAHILEGVNRHSDDGLMKSNWSEADYMQMSWKPLPFAPVDVLLIQLGLETRVSRMAKR
jgi:hypothetical protein